MNTIIQISLCLCLFAFAGCVNVDKSVDKQMPKVQEAFYSSYVGAERALDGDFGEVRLVSSWDEAIEVIYANNLDVEKAMKRLEFSVRDRGQVYRRLLPELTFSARFFSIVSELDAVTSDDVFLFANSLVSLPDPLSFWRTHAQTGFELFRSTIDAEMLLRQMHASVYQLYVEWQLIQRDELNLERNRRILALLQSDPDNFGYQERVLQMEYSMVTEESSLIKRKSQFQQDAGSLFGISDVVWSFADSFSLPSLDYASNPPVIKPELSDDFGKLESLAAASSLAAIELAEIGLVLREIPTPRFNINAPTLYRVRGGEGTSGNLDFTGVSASLYYTTDFRGTRKLSRDRSNFSLEMQKKGLIETLRSTASELAFSLDALSELAIQRDRLVRSLERIELAISSIRAGSSASATLLIKQSEIEDSLQQVNFEISSIETALWVSDDSHPEWETPRARISQLAN